MQFEEDFEFSIPKLNNNIVYFLLKSGEVVYVGKSTKGIVRPLQHIEKQYDEIKIKNFSQDMLSFFELYYISKYQPKYNTVGKGFIDAINVRNQIRYLLKDETFNLRDLKQNCKQLGINLFKINKTSYMMNSIDFKNLVDGLYKCY